MYRRVPCDWFISDGILKKVRLDAPMLITEALTAAGVVADGIEYLDRLKNEWIYRRTWAYSADFSMADEEGTRVFLRFADIAGKRSIFLNGEMIAEGEALTEEIEVTGLLQGENNVSVAIRPDTSFEMRPQIGFSGMMMQKRTLAAAVMSVSANDDGTVKTVIDSSKDTPCKIKYTVSCMEASSETEFSETLAKGANSFEHRISDDLVKGTRTDITVSVNIKGNISDNESCCIYVPVSNAAPRGFAAKTEALMGISQQAGANAVFTEPSASAGVLAARHGLRCVSLESAVPLRADSAMMPADTVYEIAGYGFDPDDNAVWGITGSDKSCWDRALSEVPSADTESVINVSRYLQAENLKISALDARAAKKAFALGGAADGMFSIASCSLIDADGTARPSLTALSNAWKSEFAYTRRADVSDDGIFSCEVLWVSDLPTDETAGIRVTAYDFSGKMLNYSSFAVSAGNAAAGRFIGEIPESGGCVVRTKLFRNDETLSVSDMLVMKNGMKLEELPQTQILISQDSVKNAGETAAVGVSVNEAGFYGCLLPGETVKADRADGVSGVNIFY